MGLKCCILLFLCALTNCEKAPKPEGESGEEARNGDTFTRSRAARTRAEDPGRGPPGSPSVPGPLTSHGRHRPPEHSGSQSEAVPEKSRVGGVVNGSVGFTSRCEKLRFNVNFTRTTVKLQDGAESVVSSVKKLKFPVINVV